MVHRPRLTTTLLPALLLAAGPAAGLDAGDGAVTVHAFGSVGYGRTDGNAFGPGNEAGRYDNTALALSVMGRPSERVLIGGQVHFNGEAVEVDWAFAEWKVNDGLRLRLGKAKQPFGNYGESLDVGTVRPFFDLPASLYGPAHLVGHGYTGAGVYGFHRLGRGWAVGYDAYGGELQAAAYEAFDQLFNPQATPGLIETSVTRDLLGGRVTLETPVEGLVFGVSSYTGSGKVTTGGPRRNTAVAASMEYLTGAVSARAEYALFQETREAVTHGGYVELAYKLPVGIQLAARVDGSWVKVDGFSGSSPLLRHQEAALGVNYWFSQDLVVKASYHLIDGNRFAYASSAAAAPAIVSTTNLVIVGAQFSF